MDMEVTNQLEEEVTWEGFSRGYRFEISNLIT